MAAPAEGEAVVEPLPWSLDQHDRDQLLFWIDPEGCASSAAPIVLADAALVAGHAGLRTHCDRQTKAVAGAGYEIRPL